MQLALAMLLTMLGAEPEPAPTLDVLIDRLGANRYEERQAAAEAIESIGGPALPALRDAAKAVDPEVRNRAEWLVSRVESTEMTQPWRVRLDFRERPVDAIVTESEANWPCRLAWANKVPESARQRRVTLREDDPLPFWAFVDRLCEAADLHYVPGSPGGEGDGRPPQFRLFLATGNTPRPHDDHGPLRLEVESISHDRAAPGFSAFGNRLPQGPPARPGWRLRLRLLAEPRLLIDRHGQIEVHEAIDDRGQSLLPPGEGPRLGYSGSDFIPAQAAISLGLGMPLLRPETPGTKIAKLRLTVPLALLSRRPEPFVLSLHNAAGRTFQKDQTTITWLGSSKDRQGHSSVSFRIQTATYVPMSMNGIDSEVWRPAHPEVTPSFVQVFDENGRQFPWFGGTENDDDHASPEALAKLTLWPEGGLPVPEATNRPLVPIEAKNTAIPTTMHVFEPSRAILRATFTLTDIPLPAGSP